MKKSVRFTWSWRRLLFGVHFICPGGDLFWSVFLGPLLIRYDYKLYNTTGGGIADPKENI